MCLRAFNLFLLSKSLLEDLNDLEYFVFLTLHSLHLFPDVSQDLLQVVGEAPKLLREAAVEDQR